MKRRHQGAPAQKNAATSAAAAACIDGMAATGLDDACPAPTMLPTGPAPR